MDRLRKLCQRTVRSSDNPVEQAVINQEADRRLLAAFINGLIGVAGKEVRMQMPGKIDKALNMAIIATNAEREEKAFSREDRGISAKVFTVGGRRESTPGETHQRYEGTRGRSQWSNRGRWSQPRRAGPSLNSAGVDETYSYRTDRRTAMGSENHVRTI